SMPEEHIQPSGQPPDAGKPASGPAPQHVSPGTPPIPGSGEPVPGTPEGLADTIKIAHGFSPATAELRWIAGLFILLAAGWGFIILVGIAVTRLRLGISLDLAMALTAPLDFLLLFALERNLWLSRFMGLRLGPHSTQLKETLFFFFLGVP